MHEFSLDYLRCVRCGSKLELNAFSKDKEIDEGLLECKKCNLLFPIISKVPILWDDFSKYLSSRIILGGKLHRLAVNEKMKKFLKDSILNTTRGDDRTALEERWRKIYQNSKNSKFYSIIKNELKKIPDSNLALEYGCSIGLITEHLADRHEIVFGVDRSFDAILFAKKSAKTNLDYIVADSLSLIFGKTKFDLILALNVLELIEPLDLLQHISKQIKKGFFIISDPYDFDRGKNSVQKPIDEESLRKNLNKLGFSITANTKNPSFHPWNLRLNSRSTLNYRVDLVVAKK